jgi:hypothetical protein
LRVALCNLFNPSAEIAASIVSSTIASIVPSLLASETTKKAGRHGLQA